MAVGYKYGMHTSKIVKVKQWITKDKTRQSIKKEFSITDGQLDFIANVLLKRQYRIKSELIMEKDLKVNGVVYSLTLGRGEIVKVFDFNLCAIKFENRKLPAMCDLTTCKTVDNPKDIHKFKSVTVG